MHHPRRPDDLGDTAPTGTVQLSDTADLLTALVYLFGFRPERSIVVVAFNRGRIERISPLDLPAPHQLRDAAASARRSLVRGRAHRVIVVGYGPQATMDLLVAFARLLRRRIHDVLHVIGQRWWSVRCRAECRTTGHPLIERDQVVAPLIATSGVPLTSAHVRATTHGALDPLDAPVAHSATSSLDYITAMTGYLPHEEPLTSYRRLLTERSAREAGSRPMPVPVAARLLLGLQDLQVRDACALWTDEGALNLWRDLVLSAPAGLAAPAATLLAVCSYGRGEAALALAALERALADDPQYDLALQMLKACTSAVRPHEVSAVLASAAQKNPLINATPRTETPGARALLQRYSTAFAESLTDPFHDHVNAASTDTQGDAVGDQRPDQRRRKNPPVQETDDHVMAARRNGTSALRHDATQPPRAG